MPRYKGRDICDWGPEIARLKREGQLDDALRLAMGCMDAMTAAAERNPINVMEHYVIEVAIIQRKMKAYAEEVRTLEDWLSRDFPAPREDFRLDLRKRLAKAQELWAKAEGRDWSEFNAEWKRLVELTKQQKEAGRPSTGISSGRSAANPTVTYPRSRSTSRLIPTESELLVNGFVAVDFETANRDGGVSACQIALVKVIGGDIVDRYSTLLKPPPGYDSFEFTYLHGISARDVKHAPMWPAVETGVSQFVGEFPVYAHNASFDARVWRDLDSFFGTSSLPQRFFCSYRTAQSIVPGLDDYKLPTVVQACAPGYRLDHHRADSDAEACALIVAALQQRVVNGQR
ncbi:DNA polymerase III subunit epsilon [Actinobaculum sp. 352]|nr:DNA polymerase III subunit epsilon [Actinobaculum sp. 352]